MPGMREILFTKDASTLRGTGVRFLEVDSSLNDRDSLLTWLAKYLSCPIHHGISWVTLHDCLRDLSWIPEKRIVLFHRELPLAREPEERLTYLEMLLDVAACWKSTGAREWVAAFHRSLEGDVWRALGSPPSRT